tara:strand:+ start:831 stop:1019 length:189 start_codon:yes stop_codon:yes gene_type:complete
MKTLKFYNRSNPAGWRYETIRCDADSVERVVRWYGGFYSGDDVTLFIDGIEAKPDHNLEVAK